MKFFNKNKIISIIGFCVFAVIIFHVFLWVTYLFRPADYNRTNMVGLEQENVDMVYVGGSAAFVYWEPLKAWKDCGYTSYSYATDTIQAENIKAYIEEARKSQNPDLFVIGVRAFQYYSDEQEEAGLRNGTNGMDMTSVSRYRLLKDYFANRNLTEDTDILSYYLDIAKYHTNTANLSSSEAWGLINNNGTSPYKGWKWMDSYAYLDEPVNFETDERAELPENDQNTLIELLEYCQSEKINALFVVCPYWITQEEQAKYNTIGDIITEYGFQYLNANEYYDEMKLDWSTDFYNKNHVNLFGAAKYTDFLEKYISENYSLTDHRGDSDYASWDETYKKFAEDEKTHANIVSNLKNDVEKTYEIQKQMKSARSFTEWEELAEDSRYTLIIAGTGEISWPENIADQKVLDKWNLHEGSSDYIRVMNGQETLDSNDDKGNLETSGVLGIWNDTDYSVSIENKTPIIKVSDKEYTGKEADNIILIFDNNYRQVIGALTLNLDKGTVSISYINE